MKLNFENKRGDNGVPSYGVKKFTPVETKLSFWKKKGDSSVPTHGVNHFRPVKTKLNFQKVKTEDNNVYHSRSEFCRTCENEAQLRKGKKKGTIVFSLRVWKISHLRTECIISHQWIMFTLAEHPLFHAECAGCILNSFLSL